MKRRQNHSRPYRGFFGSTAFTRRGASLIEVLISVTIVIISAMAAASFFASQAGGARNTRQRAACMAALDAQAAYIRQLPNSMASTWTASKSNIYSQPTNQTWFDDSLMVTSVSTTDVIPPSPGGGREYKPYLLQQGAMGVLGKLMHTVAGICSGPVDLSSIKHKGSDPFPSPINGDLLPNFKASIQIEPYNLVSGKPAACDMKWSRAQGWMDDALTSAVPPIVKFAADTSKDIGYRLKLEGTYDTPNGPASCKSDSDFSYPVDRKVPNYSVVLNVYDAKIDKGSQLPVNAGDKPGSRPQCSHVMGATPASLDLEIGFNLNSPGKIEPGTVFLCRDASEQINGDFCNPKGSGSTGAHMHGNDWPPASPPPWVPCNEVTACGIQPTSTVFTQNPSLQEQKYRNHYQTGGPGTNQPDGLWGCDIRVDVATVDPSGNFTLLSKQKNPNPGLAAFTADVGKYYQPVDCYACYKKKSSLFGAIVSLVAITFAFGLIGAAIFCATGGGGICKPNHTKFLGNYCFDKYGKGGSKFCKKVQPKYPKWFGVPAEKPCAPEIGDYKAQGYPGMTPYTLAGDGGGQAQSGEMAEDTQIDKSTGTFCQTEAVCDNGSWVPVGLDDGSPGTKSSCGKIYTGYQIDIKPLAYGASPTAGAPTCNVLIPDSSASKIAIKGASYFSSYQKCTGYQTKLGYDALCQPYYKKGKWHYDHYPDDTINNTPNNVNPNSYFYFDNSAAPNFGLPECS